MTVPTIDELAGFTLDAYSKLLKYLDQKFTIVPFCDIPDKDVPYLILRHDIDASLPSALRMAKIEKDLNIRSTYFVLFSGNFYNVFEGENVNIIKQISDLGHEIGLHYYPAQYNRYNQNPIKTLKLEIQFLEHILHKKVHSIARHGPYDRDPFTRIKEYVNANHPSIRADLFVHESDRAWTPLDGLVTLLNDPPKKVQLLVHPENWQEDKIDRVTLIKRHFDSLDKKNTFKKNKILSYFQTESLVTQYDEKIKKNKISSLDISKSKTNNNQQNLRNSINKYMNLSRYYLSNTKIGWNINKQKQILSLDLEKLKNFHQIPFKKKGCSNAILSSTVRPLFILSATCGSISGGYRRVYKLLKNAKKEGIDYVIITDLESYKNYIKMFPDFRNVINQYALYIVSAKPSKNLVNCLALALSFYKIADKEKVDLIVGSSENHQHVWASFILGKLLRKPWTFVFAGQKDIFEPTPQLGTLNIFNVLSHVSQKKSHQKTSLFSKIISSLGLLLYLNIAKGSIILSVSPSVNEEINLLNSKIKFHVLEPGNGIDLEKYRKISNSKSVYDVVFFSRLIPEKGLFVLPEVGKILVKQLPDIKIAVAGITQIPEFVELFQKKIHNYNLDKNFDFVGQKNEDELIELVKSSKMTIYPSISDSYGLVVLESLACGRPVVAYDISAMRHNFGNIEAVLRSPVGDTMAMIKNIQLLLDDEDYRTKISEAAKNYVSGCSWEKVTKAEKNAYLKLINWYYHTA